MLSSSTKGKVENVETTVDGQKHAQMVTGGPRHTLVHDYVHDTAFLLVEAKVEMLIDISDPIKNTFAVFQLLASLNRAFIFRFLTKRLVITAKTTFFAQIGKLRHQFHHYMAAQMARVVPSGTAGDLHKLLDSQGVPTTLFSTGRVTAS